MSLINPFANPAKRTTPVARGVFKPKPAEPTKLGKSDDVDMIREKVRDFPGGSGKISRLIDKFVMPIDIEKFAYDRAENLMPDQVSALVSVVMPGRIVNDDYKLISGQWKSPGQLSDEARKGLSEIPAASLIKAKAEGLPPSNQADPSKLEAGVLFNIVRDVPDTLNVRAMRDAVRQEMSIEGHWINESLTYIGDRLTALTDYLFTTGAATTDKEESTTSNTRIRIHKDRLTALKNKATNAF